MKTKLLLTIFMLAFFVSNSFSQIIFSEDFDGIPGPTSGGAGTYSFPSGWLLANVDNGTPAGAISYVNQAWERREDFSFNVTDSCAFSSSWTVPSSTANDWMWTPSFTLTTNCILKWKAVAYDASYPDGYEVRIMVAPDVPTGSAGVIGNMITNSTVLFTIAAENSSWTDRSVSLSAYDGQTVKIAFRNNSNDKFLLLIDDIVVEKQINCDAQLTSIKKIEYTQIPTAQAINLTSGGQIKNNGLNALSNVQLKIEAYYSNGNLFDSFVSDTLVTLASGASSEFTIDTIEFSEPDTYTLKYFPITTETDVEYSNDTMTYALCISDTIYSRDNGVSNGSLGIGAGNGGYIGHQFTIKQETNLVSISGYSLGGINYTNKKLAFAIWENVNGKPETLLNTSDTILYLADTARTYTAKIYGGDMHLLPGDYTVTAIEFDTTLTFGMASDIVTAGTAWVNWPTSPSGTWANVESFGAYYAKTPMIRMNIKNCTPINSTETITEATCETCADGQISLSIIGDNPPYTFSWSNNSTANPALNLLHGDYSVTIIDRIGCTSEFNYSVSFTPSTNILTQNNNFSVYPNPTHGKFSISLNNEFSTSTKLQIVNALGQIIYEDEISKNKQEVEINLENPQKGIYIIILTNEALVKTIPIVID